MASRRTATFAAALVGMGLTVAGLAPTTARAAVDDTPGYSLHHINVGVRIGPENDQTCVIDADLYLPDTASRTSRKPAILTTNGFGGSKDDSNQSAVGRGFVKHGYVVLSYTGLGFPNSGCKITLDDPDYDGKAGRQMVDVLAGKRTYSENGVNKTLNLVAHESAGDPRTGMIGGSYGGQIQYAVAMQDPRVDALIPIITCNDLAYSLAPNNTSLSRGVTYQTPGVAKKQWIDLFFTVGLTDGAAGIPIDPSRAVGCPNFAFEACPAAARLNTVGYPDAATLRLARHASVSTYMSKVKAPTLLVQGQKDTLFNLQETIATFRALRAQGTPTRMIWQSWGHSNQTPVPGELDFNASSLRSSYLGNRFLDWMNHYVRGQSTASTGPQFEYFRDWVKYDTSAARAGTAIGAAYAKSTSVSWDPTHTLYFSGGHELKPSKAAAESSSASYANVSAAPTSYSETSGLEGSQVDNEPTDAPGTFVSFTSDPLKAPADVVGSPKVTLRLSTPAAGYTQIGGPSGQLVLFAKIYDIAPDGSKVLKNRLISPLRVTDTNKLVTLRLPGIVHRFGTGHRIQVAVAASDAAYAGNTLAHRVAIMSGPASGSTVGLPIVGKLVF